jgi:hypothetical protein
MALFEQFIRNFGRWSVVENCEVKDLPFIDDIERFLDKADVEKEIDQEPLSDSKRIDSDQMVKDNQAFVEIQSALVRLMASRPSDRSRLDRHYAITITELEKAIAYFCHFVIDGNYVDKVKD